MSTKLERLASTAECDLLETIQKDGAATPPFRGNNKMDGLRAHSHAP